MAKEFYTAAKAAVAEAKEEEEFLPFKLAPDHEGKAYRPVDGQIAMLMATSTGMHLTDGEIIGGFINFLVEVIDDRSASLLISKLYDRKDPFGIPQLREMAEWIMEEWSGRPTQSSSGSTQSPPNDGQTSTPPTPLSTSSGFPFTGSATSSGSGALTG